MARSRAFAFPATAPHTLLPWDPNLNGDVYTVACATDGDIYIGGQFTTAGGATVRNLAKVDEVTGANAPAFTQHPAGRVNHVEVVSDRGGAQHLLIGWNSAPFLRSVNPITGVDDSYVQGITVSGTYQFTGVAANTTRIWNMSVFPAPNQPGANTDPRRADDRHLHLGRRAAPRAGLPAQPDPDQGDGQRLVTAELFNHCIGRQPFWAQDAAWATDMSAIYVVTHRLPPVERAAAGQRPVGTADRAVRRGDLVPGRGDRIRPDRRHRRERLAQLDQLHRVRLAVLGRRGCADGVHRWSPAVDQQLQRL